MASLSGSDETKSDAEIRDAINTDSDHASTAPHTFTATTNSQGVLTRSTSFGDVPLSEYPGGGA